MQRVTKQPNVFSSYGEEVIFLLKDVSASMHEMSTEERERRIQQGVSYSEMLPIEHEPEEEYMNLFYETVETSKRELAIYVGVLGERIVKERGLDNLVLVSLARAGTPIGALVRRYLSFTYEIDVKHYTMSIIRGKGIDEVALHYIFAKHPQANIQFVDGWTGKGAITLELAKAVTAYNKKYNRNLSSKVGVIADPAYCTEMYGTREDIVIPSALLNSTVSGLVSRTVLHPTFIGKDDFHGAKTYIELADKDVSIFFLNEISEQFFLVHEEIKERMIMSEGEDRTPTWIGLRAIEELQHEFGIESMHHLKPSVGETTRVLLRRVPWMILVNPKKQQHLSHIYLLCKEKNIKIVEYVDMPYACCGLIKKLEE